MKKTLLFFCLILAALTLWPQRLWADDQRQSVIEKPDFVTVEWSDNSHPWVISTIDGKTPGLMSSIAGISSTESQTQITFSSESKPYKLIFDYYVESEGGSFDYMTLSLDGVTIDQMGGTGLAARHYVSALLSGSHSLNCLYRKDGSVDNGLDRGFVYNMLVATLSPISITSGAHCTATVDSAAFAGDTVRISTTVEDGYVLITAGDGIEWVDDTTFIMPNAAAAISVTAGLRELHSISTAACEHGTLSVDKTQAYPKDTVAITVTAEEGYLVREILVNKDVRWLDNTHFIMPVEDVTVSANIVEWPTAVLMIDTFLQGTTIVTRGDDTLSTGATVAYLDTLTIYYDMDDLFELQSDGEFDYTITLRDTERDTFRVAAPTGIRLRYPNISALYDIDNHTTRVVWDTPAGIGYDFIVTPTNVYMEALDGMPIIRTTANSYVVDGLEPNHNYRAYVRINDPVYGLGEWNDYYFTKYSPLFQGDDYEGASDGDCWLHIEMSDMGGDGWDGELLIFCDDQLTDTVTLLDGAYGEADVEVHGLVEIRWNYDGPDYEEVNFTITNGDGHILRKTDYYEFDDTYEWYPLLYRGYPCQNYCTNISSLSAAVSHDSVTVSWTADNAASYRYAVSYEGTVSLDALAEMASTTSESGLTFMMLPARSALFYVQAVCPDGETSPWRQIRVQSDSIIDVLAHLKDLPWVAIPVDTIVSGFMLTDGFVAQAGGNIYGCAAYSFSLTDTTDIKIVFNSDEGGCALLNDTLGIIDGGNSMEERLAAGTYYILVNGTPDMHYKLYLMESKPIEYDTITIPYFCDTISLQGAGLYSSPELGYMKSYVFSVTDTVKTVFRLLCDGARIQDNDVRFIVVDSVNNSYHYSSQFMTTLVPGQNYYAHICCQSTDDIFTLSISPYQSPAIRELTLDSLYYITLSDSLPMVSYHSSVAPGVLYKFTLEESAQVSAFYTYDYDNMSNPDACLMIGRDSLFTGYDIYCAYTPTVTTSGWRENLSAGTYYVTLVDYFSSKPSVDVCFSIRTSFDKVTTAFAPADTLTVGTPLQLEVGPASPYNGSYWGGDLAVAKVYLEKGKYYRVSFAHEGDFQSLAEYILIADSASSTVYSSTLPDGNTISYYAHPNSSRYYTLVGDFGQAPYSLQKMSYPVHLKVDTVAMTFSEFVAQLDTVSLSEPMVVDTNLTSAPLVLWDGSAGFQLPHSAATSFTYASGYPAYGVDVVLQPGDSLFAELSGSEDMVLYIYPFEHPNYGKSLSRIYANDENLYPEYALFINDADTAMTVTVVGTFYNIDNFDARQLRLRLSKSVAFFTPTPVTAVISEPVVYVNELSQAAIEQAVAGEYIVLLDEQGNVVDTVDNAICWWSYDLYAGKAYYAFLRADLPLGYTCADARVYLEVTVRVRQLAYADVNVESLEVTELTDAAVRAAIADEVAITLSDATGQIIATVDHTADCWSAWTIDLEAQKASLELTDAMLPVGYRFDGGKAVITVDVIQLIVGVDNIHGDSNASGAIKRLDHDHIVIILPDGRTYDATGRRM